MANGGIFSPELWTTIQVKLTSGKSRIGNKSIRYVAAIGGLGGVALGATISTYVNSITSNIYDDVCDYYKDK